MSTRSSVARARDSNSPFVPSPRWLSESPARQPTLNEGNVAHISYPVEPLPASRASQAPSFRGELRSPIPPPPANLHKGNPSAFNVDPGIPFLATAGPSDAGSDQGSVREESPREKNSLGSLVSGIKKVGRSLTLRESAKNQRAVSDMYSQPPELRDSGYGVSSPQLNIPPPERPRSHPMSHQSAGSLRAFSNTLLGDHEERRYEGGHHEQGRHDRDDPTIVEHQRILSPEILMSPVSADPEYGPDYAQMNLPTPPPSDVSFNTYLTRAQKFAHTVNKLPWIAKERVTTDFYPQKSRRKDEPKHHPAINWHSQHYTRPTYRASEAATPAPSDASSPTPSVNPNIFITPQRRPYADVNLGDEFETQTPLPANPAQFTPMPQNPPHFTPLPQNPPHFTPLPQNPPHFTPLPQNPPHFTPRSNRVRGTSLAEAGRVMLSDPGPMPLHPPSAQPPNTQPPTPRHYVPPPPIYAISDADPRTPSPESPTGDWVDWAGPVQQARNSPIGTPQPQQGSAFGSQYAAPYAQSGTYTPRAYDQDPAGPPQQSGYPPSRASSRSRHRVASRVQTPARSTPHAPLSVNQESEWEEYPPEVNGYVPYEYSENFYGNIYGPGIHAERPPVLAPPISGPPSAASSRRR